MKQPIGLAAMLIASSLTGPAFAAEEPATSGEVSGDAAPEGLSAPADSAESLAKKLSNPVASLISVPFQYNVDFGAGLTGEATKMTLNVQPVVPISISKSANLIVRTIVPVIWQTNLFGNELSEFGLGDTTQSFFYSPKAPMKGGIIWGAGPVFYYPTGTNEFTTGKKWGAGPTFVVLKQAGPATIGLLANHIWSVAGSSNRPDISATYMQPFISYTTKRATTFGINTESTYNWETKKWLVPINATVAQLVRIGKQPVSFTLGGRYYVSSPEFGPRWGARFVTTLLFPKK